MKVNVSDADGSFMICCLNNDMKVLLCSINTHFSDCLGFLYLTMSLCVSKYDNTSSVLIRIYKCACRTSSLDLLMTCTPFEDLLINLRGCQHFSGTPIDLAFDKYSQ